MHIVGLSPFARRLRTRLMSPRSAADASAAVVFPLHEPMRVRYRVGDEREPAHASRLPATETTGARDSFVM